MGCPNPCVVHWALLLGLLAWKANSQSPDTQRMGFATDNGVHNDGQASRLQENQAKYADPDTFSALVARGTNPNNDQHWQKFDNETYPLKFNGTAQKKTLQQVNAAAPVINITMGNDTVQARPHVRQVARTPDGSLIASGLSLPGAPAPAPAASRQSRKGRSKSPRISQDEVGHLTEGPDGSLYINGVRIQSAPDAAIHKVADAMKQAQASSADQQAWPEVARLPVDSSEPFPVDSSEPSPAAAPSLAAVNEEAVRPLVRGNSSGHAESVHSMSAGNKHGPVRANTFRGGPEAILDTPLLGGIQGYSVDILSLIVGVRVSMPWLGWGFNFCVGRCPAASTGFLTCRSNASRAHCFTNMCACTDCSALAGRRIWGEGMVGGLEGSTSGRWRFILSWTSEGSQR